MYSAKELKNLVMYAEDSILCRTLNLVGNFYSTPKEAQKHSGEWAKY